MNIGQLIATIGGDVTPLKTAISEAEMEMRRSSDAMASSMETFNRSMEKAGRQMKSVGASLSKYVTLPMLAVGAGAFKMQKDFESSMSKIVGLVGVARNEVNEWGDELIRRAPEWGKAPNELAEALFYITSAGHRGAKAMELLEISAKASASGLGETKTIAHLTSSAMNAYGYDVLDAAKATDILVATVKEGKLAPEELAQSMASVIPIASELGVGFNEVGAAMAAMSRTGTNAAEASTALRGIFMSLTKATDQQEATFSQFGTSSEKLRDMLSQPGGLINVLNFLNDAADGNVSVMAEMFPNVRGLTGVLDMMGGTAKDTTELFARMEDSTGSLDHAFSTASDTLEFRWNKMLAQGQSAMTALGGTIRQAFLPVLEILTGWMESLTNWFLDLNETQKQWVMWIGVVVTALGPMLTMLGFLVGNIIPMLVRGFVAVRAGLGAMQIAVMKLTAVIAANPIGALAVGITAAVAALYFFNRRAGETKSLMDEIHAGAMQNTASERMEVQKLLTILNSEQATREQKERALRQLNEISPEYFKNLTLEGDAIEKTNEAAEQYNKTLVRRAQIQVAQERLAELERERWKALEEGTDEARSGMQRLTTFLLRTTGDQMAADAQAGAQRVKNVEDAQEAYLGLQQSLLDSIISLEAEEDAYNNSKEAIDGVADSAEEVASILENQTLPAIENISEALAEMERVWDEMDFSDSLNVSVGTDFQLDDPMSGWVNVMDEYTEALRRASVNNELFGDSFDQVGANITATEQAIQSMISQGFDQTDPAIEMLMYRLQELEKQIDSAGNSMIDWSSISQTAAQTVGQSFLNAAAAGNVATSQLIKQLTAQIVGQLIAQIVATLPFPINLGVAAGAGVMAGALINQIPEFAQGGLVTGPTLAMVGEYPGAKTNPEVIAPLDKLQAMITNTESSRGGTLSARVSKGDLLFVLQEAEAEHKRSF